MKADYINIHKALHDPTKTTVQVSMADNQLFMTTLPIKVAGNGCRYVEYEDNKLGDTHIMVQNPNTPSGYAARAKRGEHLTWVIPVKNGVKRYGAGPWQLITDSDKPDYYGQV